MATLFWIVLIAGAVGLFLVTRGGGSPADLAAWRERGATVVDVRTPGEFASGHVRDARNIPVDQLLKRLDEVPPGPVIVYCASGMRSRRARAILEGAEGYEVLDMSRLGNFPASERT
jgi:rhodanese-related sulfurtransferase